MNDSNSSSQASSWSWPEGKGGAVSLTFDDARLSQIDRGLSLLDAYDVKATFYVSAGNVASRLEGWREAAGAGHEIGNHTLNHPCSGNFAFARANALEDYTLERMEAELTGANDAIHHLLNVTPTTFAYPCGQTFVGRGEDVRSYVPLVAKHFVVGRGAFDESANDPVFCDLAQVAAMEADGKTFAQLRQLLDRAADEGRWLVLYGHEVGKADQHQTVSAAALENLCEYLQRSDSRLWVDTVAAVGEYIRSRRES